MAARADGRAALDSGVTTVPSAGVSNFIDVGLRDLVTRGDLPGLDVLATGYHVRPQPAAEACLEAPELGDLMGGLTTTDALRRFVRFNLSRNVDWITVLATERAGTPDTDPRKLVYTEAELTVIVAEAAARGVPVLAALQSATTVNAELLKLSTQIGQVQPRALLDPLLVISNGRVALDRLSFGK